MEERIKAFEAMGFIGSVAEALAERDVTPEHVKFMSERDILDHYLTWNGIGGFTGSIIAALDNARNVLKHGPR